MGYVALSRVKNIENLYLYGINRMALQMSEDAVAINEVLLTQSAHDAARFADLAEQAAKRQQEASQPTVSVKKGSSWTEKLAEMRKTHPNAYKPWSARDDAELVQHFQQGESIADLMARLGRHENSIIIRLKKLLGDDVVQ